MKDIVKKIIYLDPKDILNKLNIHGIILPRKLRYEALKKVIMPNLISQRITLQVKQQKSNKLLSLSDSKRLVRLKYLNSLSEIQLESEYDLLGNDELNKTYLVELWSNITSYLNKMFNNDNFTRDLSQFNPLPNFFNKFSVVRYNRILDDVFRDETEFIDGVHYTEIRSYMYYSSNINELIKLGKKYHIDVPRYYTKADLKSKILDYLKENDLFNKDIEEELSNFNIKQLKQKLDSYGLSSKTNQTKEDIIEYILSNYHQLKNFYVKPSKDDKYGVKEDSKEKENLIVPVVNKETKMEQLDNKYMKSILDSLKEIAESNTLILEQIRNFNPINVGEEKKKKSNTLINYTLIFLVIFVAVIWIIFGINNLI